MTATPESAVSIVEAHKALARRLREALRDLAPDAKLSHAQTLHIVAALHGLPNWQTLLARPDRARLPDTPALEALRRSLQEYRVQVREPQLVQALESLEPLNYSVLQEEEFDSPGKTEVAVSLLLEGHIRPGALRQVLLREFDRVSRRGGFRYHPHPTAIFIWAFPTVEHHQAGAGQTAGMLQRSHSDFEAGRAPQITVNETLIRAVQQLATDRFGLTEPERRILFLDHCRVTNRARIAADHLHPFDARDPRDSVSRNTEHKSARLAEWDTQIAEQHKLTPQQYREVIVEGLVRSWPMASLQDTQTQSIP